VLAASFFVFTFLAVIAGLVVIVGSRLPAPARRWAWLPISVMLTVVVFADEGYNEYVTRQVCSREGGMEFGKTISAPSTDAGMRLIDTRKQDFEDKRFWRHELLFLYRPTGEELARLRWFDRKHGWLQGNVPGADRLRYLSGEPCPDPQEFLASGSARSSLVRTP
jgi:hypothetical protein